MKMTFVLNDRSHFSCSLPQLIKCQWWFFMLSILSHPNECCLCWSCLCLKLENILHVSWFRFHNAVSFNFHFHPFNLNLFFFSPLLLSFFFFDCRYHHHTLSHFAISSLVCFLLLLLMKESFCFIPFVVYDRVLMIVCCFVLICFECD